MRVLFFNANSLAKAKLDLVKAFADAREIDLIFIVETHLKPGEAKGDPIFSLIKPLGEDIVGGRRANGGIILYSPEYGLRQGIDILDLDIEANYAIVKAGDIILAVGYFPARAEFDAKLYNFLEKAKELADGRRLILFGDLNARMGHFSKDTKFSTRGGRLKNWLQDQETYRLRNPDYGRFTSFSTRGAGVTDIILLGNDARIKNMTVHTYETLGGSDHRPITFEVDVEIALDHRVFERLDIRKLADEGRRELYLENLEASEEFIEGNDLEEHWQQFKGWIWHAAKASIGLFKYQRWGGTNTVFMDDSIKQSLLRIEQLQLSIQANADNPQACREFKRDLRMQHTLHDTLIQNRKRTLFQDAVDNLANPQNAGAFQRMVSGASRRRSRGPSALKTTELDLYADYFASTFGRPVRIEAVDDQVEFTVPPDRDRFQLDEIMETLTKAPLGKAPGKDKLPGELYRYGGRPMARAIKSLFNKCFRTGKVPKEWNEALIHPVFKNKGSEAEIKNYRPIALTCVIRRLYEMLILRDISNAIQQLHPCQGGFRVGRSTTDMVYSLDEIIRCNPGLHVIYLDFKAAYDLVDRRLLWKALRVTYGVDENTIKRLQNLFDGTSSQIVLKNKKSKVITHERGLFQGSSASPTLFNLFINSLLIKLDNLPKVESANSFRSNALLFADDSSIHAKNITDLRTLLDTCEEWSILYDMRFAPEKCIYVGDATEQDTRQLRLYGKDIRKEHKAKYLGIWMDSQGIDWDSVVKERTGKAARTIAVMSQLGMNATGWATTGSVNVYKAFVRPQMEYGLALKPLDAQHLASLNRVQNLAMRKILGSPKNGSIGCMAKLLQLEPMQHRNQILNIQQAARLHNSTDSSRPAVVIWWGMLEFARNSRLGPYASSLTLQSTRNNPLWKKVRLRDHIFSKLAPPTRATLAEEITWNKRLWKPGQKKIEKYRAVSSSATGSVADSLIYSFNDPPRPHLLPQCGRRARVTINRWLIGLVCLHQVCFRCGATLTRAHGVGCSGAYQFLQEKLHDINALGESGDTLIDKALNKYRKTWNLEIYSILEQAIALVLKNCRDLTQEENHYWRPAGNQGHATAWNHGAEIIARVDHVANPLLTQQRHELAILRNRRRGRPSRFGHTILNPLPRTGMG